MERDRLGQADDRLDAIIEELRRVNRKMKELLVRLPLTEHTELAELAKLSERQVQLLRIEIASKRAPLQVMTLLNKERDSAIYLKDWYARELLNGRLRE